MSRPCSSSTVLLSMVIGCGFVFALSATAGAENPRSSATRSATSAPTKRVSLRLPQDARSPSQLALGFGLDPKDQTAKPDRSPAAGRSGLYFKVHRTLGGIALGSFATALVIGAASGNLGKLTDPNRCCPDGGDRIQPWRNIDRTLVNTGIVAYSGAAALALWNLTVRNPPGPKRRRTAHKAHRWLALAHGAAFLTSAVTGVIMFRSQADDPDTFASAARVHVASNVILVPLLTAAMSNIIWE